MDISNPKITNKDKRLKFDYKYGGAFLLKNIKQVKVNNDVRLPDGLWKKLTKDILPEIIAYGKMPTIIIDGLEYQNALVINDIKGTKWRLPTKEEVDKLKIANLLKNSKGEEFYVRKEFVENLPKNFYQFNFNGLKIEESHGISSLLNISLVVTKYVREIEVNIKRLEIEKNICKKNGGRNEALWSCYANWNNAIKICSEIGGKLLPQNMLTKTEQLSDYWVSKTDINEVHYVKCISK